MANNSSRLLSMFLFLPMTIFSFDLLNLASQQENIGRIATQLSSQVQMEHGFWKEMKQKYEQKYQIKIEASTMGSLSYGDSFSFTIQKEYESLLFSTQKIQIETTRFIWIGLYHS